LPELPDIELYVHALRERILGHTLVEIRVANPFLIRSVAPPLSAAAGRRIVDLDRLGKRIALGLQDDYWLVLHLMIAGRLQWVDAPPPLKARSRLASFDFDSGSLLLTESATKKRASLYLVHGRDAMEAHRPDGIEPLRCTLAEFTAQLDAENRTLKRILTDPSRFSGIGNAYSDEILHAAKLSPAKLTSRLAPAEKQALFAATRTTLRDWCQQLLDESDGKFPAKVSAFKPAMAVHGRFGLPCPVCKSRVQRIRYKSRETNYCPDCQTGGKILADRSLSRLLKDGWPESLDRPEVH
jgi:formamidopyrimidine-DNA glycosylase